MNSLKVLITVILSLLFLTALADLKQSSSSNHSLRLINNYQNAELYKLDNLINIVVIRGTFYEMGKQYGYLLKDQLQESYQKLIINDILKKNITIYKKLNDQVIQPAWRGFPANYRAFFRGVSETSGMPIDKLILLDQTTLAEMYYIHQIILLNEGNKFTGKFSSCSYLGVWGKHTSNGSTIIGRNFDWLSSYSNYGNLLTVTVFEPIDGNKVATIGYVGWIGSWTAFNDKGLFMEQNAGFDSPGLAIVADYMPFKLNALDFMFGSDSIYDLQTKILSTRPNWSIIINTADKNVSYDYEDSIYSIKKRTNNPIGSLDSILSNEKTFDLPEAMVATNQYMDPAWGIMLKDDATLTRYINLAKLALKYKNNFSVDIMKQVFSFPLYNKDASIANGVTLYSDRPSGGLESEATVHQVVADLSTNQIWIRIPTNEQSEWHLVDLSKWFKG